MNEKEYFKKLVSLFEAKSDEEEDLPEMASEDQYNVDSGEDAMGNASDQMQTQTNDEQGDLGEEPELGDADYLSSDGERNSNLPPMNDPVAESKKMGKLFDLFKDLLNYSNVFKDSLTTIDMNLLDGEKIGRLRNNIEHVEKIIEKLRKYIIDTLPTEKYEKALYVYILLRTELLTVIKLLRESLELNTAVIDDAEDPKKQDKNDQKDQKK
jgi:hypothetical protein